jgi:glycosyltransferase EpsF
VKVLIFLNWLGRGGVETMLLDCLPHLRARGVEVDVCCQGRRRELDADYEAQGCRIFRIRKCAVPLETAWRIEAVLEESRPALLHSQMGPTSGGVALAAARRGIPALVSIHNLPESTLYGWVGRPLLGAVRSAWLAWHRRLLDRHARLFLGHSQANLDAFEPDWRNRPGSYRLIANGIKTSGPALGRDECRRELGIEPGRPVVLHVGSFKPQKNHEGLLLAFEQLLRRAPGALLLTVGDGAGRGRVERRARAMRLERSLRLDPGQNDVRRYYFAADVMLSASLVEGFGNALVEAQGAGLPVVASDIPAHRESVAPTGQRFLFPLPDYARAAELILEQVEAARAGRNPWVGEAQEHVRARFSVERMAGELADIYGEVAGGA